MTFYDCQRVVVRSGHVECTSPVCSGNESFVSYANESYV